MTQQSNNYALRNQEISRFQNVNIFSHLFIFLSFLSRVCAQTSLMFCSQGEEDESAIDVNLSGSLAFEKIMLRYIPNYHHQMPLKFGVLNGETKLSGSLLRP